jgi:DNA-binding response OmpR family regulator
VEDTHKLQTGVILMVAPRGLPSYVEHLQHAFNLSIALTVNDGVTMLAQAQPTLVIIDQAVDTDATTLCGAAKDVPHPPPVLVTMSRPDLAAHVLIAGCAAILLMPFEPGVLLECIGRILVRQDPPMLDAEGLRHSASRASAESSPRIARATTTLWPDADCPYCREGTCVSFDAVSPQRLWYTCLRCWKVWIAPAADGR